jgi:hypothetical protein
MIKVDIINITSKQDNIIIIGRYFIFACNMFTYK